jgi:hypothetical protein
VALAPPPGANSTEKDNERTSALKSEFTFASELANRMMAGWIPGLA